jgi:hypothetical protein
MDSLRVGEGGEGRFLLEPRWHIVSVDRLDAVEVIPHLGTLVQQ